MKSRARVSDSILKWSALTIVALGTILLILSPWESTMHLPSGIITPEETIGAIRKELQSVDPSSAEAARLRALLQKVRSKAAGETTESDPGGFLEALDELRRGTDGSTYRSGYLAEEYAHVRAQLEKGSASPSALLPWTMRGPGNIAGRARAIAVDPSDPSQNTWFVATVGGGVWKTTDAGSSWEDKSPEMTTYTAMTLAIAESDPNVIYVGTGMGYGRVVDITGTGVWKSVDGGDSWRQLEATADGQVFGAINRIVIDPNDEDIVLLASNNSFAHLSADEGDPARTSGIFRSTDGGSTWRQVFDPDAVLPIDRDNRVQQIIATPGDFNRLYASVNEVGVVRSTDAGLTWEISADNFADSLDIGNPNGGWTGLSGVSVRTELAIAGSNPNRIYAAVERPRGIADLYMSVDAGESWEILTDNGQDPNWFNSFGASGATGAYTAGWFDNAIAVSPYDENEVIVGGVNLYRITVNPNSATRTTLPIGWWTINTQGIPLVHADHHFLVTIMNNDSTTYTIIDASDGGIASSIDGGNNWRQLGAGMGTTQFYGVDKMPGESRYIGGMQDNGTWFSPANPTSATTWLSAVGGDGFEAVWHFHDPNRMLVTQQFGSVLRSTDMGSSWVASPGAQVNGGQFITKLANCKADPDMVYTIGPGGVGRSDDFGASWSFTPITKNWIGYRPFSNVEASIANPYVVWISSKLTVDRVTGTTGGVHVSRDGALSFDDVTANLPAGFTEPSGIGTHPTDPRTAFLLFATPGTSKILRTTDYGESWVDISGFSSGDGVSDNGFPDVGVFSLLVMPYDTRVLWAGTEIGLFESTDGGESWHYADNGFPRVTTFELKVVDDEVIAATYGRGIWSVTLPKLKGYRPPVVTLIPQISKLAMAPDGRVTIKVERRSRYDSASLMIDGQEFESFSANSLPNQTSHHFFATEEKTISVQTVAWREGQPLPTAPQTLFIYPTSPTGTWSSGFELVAESQRLVTSPEFTLAQPSGFTSRGVHTTHPYPNQREMTMMIRNPIIVAENVDEAIVRFDEIVLAEPGNAAWPLAGAFDYCIVEGSNDGCEWVALVDGYDSRANKLWLDTYLAGVTGNGSSLSTGDESMYIGRNVGLQPKFAAGDTIFLRWRLSADPAVNGWGWAIDNVDVQPMVGGTPGEVIRRWILNLR